MDSSPREPTRLSALYQYHNAPEVAPAHGLEYDDTIYPASDKYPVVRESPLYDGKFSGNARYYGDGSNRPPRIIFGMKIRTFLIVALVMILIVVGAAVGGAIGGKQLREEHETQLSANVTNTALPATATTPPTQATVTATSSTFSAPVPTYAPLNDCPASNNTEYTSQYAANAASSSENNNNNALQFTKFCSLQNPLSTQPDTRIASAFVYSFSDCIELCAGYNNLHSNNNCSVAVYEPSAPRPGNCWIGAAGVLQAWTLDSAEGINVAVLQQ